MHNKKIELIKEQNKKLNIQLILYNNVQLQNK